MTRSLVFACLLLAACSKTPPEPAPAPAPSTKPAETTEAKPTAAKAASEDLAYDPPSGWQQMPNPNTMRKATFKVPKVAPDTDDGELTLSAALGGVDKNVERWALQFGAATPTREKRKVGPYDVTVVTIKGKYAGGGPMMGGAGGATPPKEGYMLLGAIVEDPTQPHAQAHFFKLVGPEKTLTAAKPDFDKLVASVRPGK